MNSIQGKVKWVNIFKPTTADLSWLRKELNLHRLILEELKGPSSRARVEVNKNYLYLIYYFPIYDPVERVSKRSEIDILVTKSEVVTVSYEKIEVFDELTKTLNKNSRALEDSLKLTHKIIDSLLDFQQRQMIHIREKLETVSVELFKEKEREREQVLLEQISYLKRDISQYRLIIKPQKHILESFFQVGCNFFNQANCSVYMNDLIGEHMKITDLLEDYRQAIEDFEDTNNQLINIKNSQLVKTFTILAFLTFPMMLFASLFSMNTRGTPIVNNPRAFWIVLGVMIIAMTGMFAYFKKKDWL
ncbi:MAG: hypothetical protein HY093_00825 [Candidatus Liptonbacteria bacterium]|nr:hypothetical protein [Candidatus Liptonbacteria bacterium]